MFCQGQQERKKRVRIEWQLGRRVLRTLESFPPFASFRTKES